MFGYKLESELWKECRNQRAATLHTPSPGLEQGGTAASVKALRMFDQTVI